MTAPRGTGRFHARTAVVTGAATGIDAATAHRLADEGAGRGIPGHPAYAAAKGGLLSLSGQLTSSTGPRCGSTPCCPGRA